jgi:glycosyltransferase involved in cell wall biosynthesis
MWTFMDVATLPTVVTIPFGLASIPVGTPRHGQVGTLYLKMNEQQAKVWGHILKYFVDAELTGYGNPFPSVEPKSYQEFNERFGRMDIFVHTVVGNSVGLSFAEAMMRGIPVITGMNTDLPKELIDGWNCVITRGHAHDCLDEMIEAIKLLITDRDRRFRIGLAARETAKRIWGLDKLRTNWNHVFNGRLGEIP